MVEDLQPILQNRSNLEALLRIQDDYNALVRFMNDLQLFNISLVTTGECILDFEIILKHLLPVDMFVYLKFIVIDSECK